MKDYRHDNLRRLEDRQHRPIAISKSETEKPVSRELIVGIALIGAAVTGLLMAFFRMACC